MSSNYYNMLDSTGASGFLPTVVFDGSSGVFTSLHRINTLASIGITGFYEADFANAVTDISYGAFQNDSKVVVVTINKVATIRDYAFNGCTAMRSITLDTADDGIVGSYKYLLTSIGTNAFNGCTSLRNLHIPDTVKNIPDSMCSGCTSLEVAVMGYGYDRTGNTYNTNGTIGSSAFANCSRLSYFVVPETVSSIDASAFVFDVSLALVYILGRPTISSTAFNGAMGAGATYYYDMSKVNLTVSDISTTFPAAATKNPYREIDLSAGAGTALSAANVTAALTSVTSWWKGKILSPITTLASNCFRATTGIAAVKYEKMIGVSFPSGLINMASNVFQNSDGGTNITNCNVGAFYFPVDFDGVSSSSAFSCTSTAGQNLATTKQFVFQSGYGNSTTLVSNMFQYTSAMAIVVPKMNYFGSSCFQFAKYIQYFNFFQKNAYNNGGFTKIDGYSNDSASNVFSNCFNALTARTHYLYIPKQIARIATSAFIGSTNPLYITAYSSTTDGAAGAGLCATSNFLTNTYFTGSVDPSFNLINNYYDANGLTLGTVAPTTGKYHVLFSSGVKTISSRFASSTILKTVTIPDSVTSIGSSAFSGCTGLTNVSFSPTSGLVSIGPTAFYNCFGLTTITIPSLVTDISTSAFVFCTGLTSVSFSSPGSLVNIGNAAFSGCTGLTDISINRAKSIGSNAFHNVPLSNTFDLSGATSLEAIYYAAFLTATGTSNLRQITIPLSVKALGAAAFRCFGAGKKPFFTTLSFASGIEFWGDYDTTLTNATTTASYGVDNTSSPYYMAIPVYFCQNCDALTSIDNVLNKNPLYIGNFAFNFCNKLATITIPDTVKTIGTSAFSDCSGLTSASISATSNLVTIGSSAFLRCNKLTTITIPSLVTTIGASAFSDCSGLTRVSGLRTGSLVDIGSSAFSGCTALTDISMNRAKSIGSTAFYNVPLSNTFDLSSAISLEAIYYAAFITTIGTSNLRQITIPISVKVLGSLAFGCLGAGKKPSFTTLSFENGIEFWGDYNNTLSSASTTASYEVLNTSSARYMAIPASFCSNCDYLTSISFLNTVDANGVPIPADASGVLVRPNNSSPITTRYNSQNLTPAIKRIGTYAFAFNHRLQSIRIPEGVTTIDASGFSDTHSLSYLYLPDSLTAIGLDAFDNMGIANKFSYTVTEVSVRIPQLFIDDISATKFSTNNVSTIYATVAFDNTSTSGKVTGNVLGRFTTSAVNNYFKYHVITLNGITGILGGSTAGARAFDGITSLKTVTIADTVTSIGVSCLSGCTGLTSVSGLSTGSLVDIGSSAFNYCTALTDISMNRAKSIGVNAFRNALLSNTFDLSSAISLEAIYHAAFYTDSTSTYTSQLRQITVPKSVKYLGSYVFGNGEPGRKPIFTTLSFENGIEIWGDYDGSVAATTFTDTDTASARYMAIPAYFCINCDNLTNISFLNTVDANGVPIPADTNGALARPNNGAPITTRYNSQTLTNKIKRIGTGVFLANHRLQSIRIPDGVTMIDAEAFYDAHSLSYLYLPDSLTTIGTSAFNFMGTTNKFGYTGKEVSVRIPQTVIQDISYTKFSTNNVSTLYVTVPFDNTAASGKVTGGVLGRFTTQPVNTYIKYHVITLNGITGILGSYSTGTRAFDNYTSLKTLTIADTVTNIGPGAHENCTGLTNIFISPTSNLTFIDSSAFYGCTALTSFFIPNSLDGINATTFSGCTSLASVTYGNNPGIKYIGPNAFYGATKALTSIFIPSSVVYIGSQAFITGDGTNILNTVTFGAGSRLRYIGGACLGVVSGTATAATYLRDLVLPNTIRVIGTNSVVDNTTCQAFRNAFTQVHSANLIFPTSLEFLSESILYTERGASTLDISNIYLPLSITNVAGPRKHCGYTTNGIGNFMFAPSSSKTGSLIYLPSDLSGYTGGGATAFPDANRTRSYYKTVSFTSNPLTSLGFTNPIPSNVTSPSDTTQIHADIKEGVTVIGSGASIASANSGNPLKLISMNIPSTVTDICANAFSGCSAMAYVTFSENSKLTTIGANAFLGCSTIHDIQLPDTLTTIGQNAFSGCYNLASISIPYNVTSSGLGAGAFNINSPMTYITRPAAYLAYQLGSDIYGEAISDYSGYSVSLSQDGKILAIGSVYNDGNGWDAGQVRIYKYQTITDTTWANYTVNSFSNTGTSPFNKPVVVNGSDALPVSGKSYWVQLGSDINGEAVYNYAGFSVSLCSDVSNGIIVAIGALVNSGAGGDAGQVRVYKYQTITDSTWANYRAGSFNYTGTSPDNKPIVVNGGDTDNPISGKFYWVQLGVDIDGEAANIQSGNSVSLSSNGKILAIGARFDDTTAKDSGSVRLYQYRTIAETVWINNYTVNSFTHTGTSPTNKPIVVNGGDVDPIAGKFYWVQMGGDINGEATDNVFGYYVSLSDNGQTVAISATASVGATGTDLSAGRIRVYKYITNAWTQLGSNINGEAASDYSGESVSLNDDGTILAIGAVGNDGGANDGGHVRVYKYDVNKTTNVTDQTSIDFGPIGWRRLGRDIDGVANFDHFGNSVSLSMDGTILAVGSRYSDTGSVVNTGLVRIYKYNGTTWQQLGQDIRGDFANDQAGWSVSLSRDGTTVAVGANGNDGNGIDSGMVRVYQINQFTVPIRLHQRLYNDISGSLSTYFPGIYTGSVQVIPALQLTNTLNPSSLTISQINNMYIRYRQSQLGVTFVTVSASVGGTLSGSDVTTALASSTGFVHLDISTNVTYINANICENNLRIYSLAIPKTVTDISTSAFNACKNLTYLSFHPDSVCNAIGVNAFGSTNSGGNNIIDLALPDSLTKIGGGAFSGANRLTSVCIPKSVTTLDLNAFQNCSNLTSVALPSQLSSANTSSYFSATNTISFSIYDTAAAIPHFKLSEYSLPSGIVQNVVDSAVTYIDHRAYAYYPDITLYAVTTNKQTQTAGQFNYVMNGIKMPFQPAAFLLNGSGFASNSMFPLYRSVPDLNVYSLSDVSLNWIQNVDDFYILMPGYSICIYNNLYDEENLFNASPTERYYDNEFGKVPLNISVPAGVVNTTTSILIMYKGRILSKYFST